MTYLPLSRLFKSNVANGFQVHGYGFFFTSKRLIGISYRRIVLVAYLIPFGIFLLWLGILLPVVSWGVQNDPIGSALPLPAFILLPPLAGLPITVAAFVLYLSPRRVPIRIQRRKPKSIQDLMSGGSDVTLERSNIAEITIDRNPNPLYPNPRTTIQMKTGEQYFFDIRVGEFYGLLSRFCELTPEIRVTTKTRLWK